MSRIKRIQYWLHNNYRHLRFWFGVVLAIVIIVLMFKAINAIQEQTAARDDAVQSVLTGLDNRTKEINDNSNRNTVLLCKTFRQLLGRNDGTMLEQQEVAEIEQICKEELERSQNSSTNPEPDTFNQNQNTNETQNQGEPAGPQPANQNENAQAPGEPEPQEPPPTPLLLPEGQGVIRDSVPILGRF